MGAYNIIYNKDESVIRQIIIGLLADLNNKLYFYNQHSDNERKKIEIPFYYSISGDESFLQQYFQQDIIDDTESDHSKFNYDSLPMGVVNLNSMNIDSDSLLNKHVYGTYNRNIEGTIKTMYSKFQLIPMIFSFDVEIRLDSVLEIFKVTEGLIKLLYKNNIYTIEAGNPNEASYKLSNYYKLPENYDNERPIEFGFDEKKKYTVTFQIEMHGFIPSIDFEHEIFAGNKIMSMESNVQLGVDDPKTEMIGEPIKPKYSSFNSNNSVAE